MNLYFIKLIGIFLVTMCCIIATYTDVKRQVIPNKLTFSTIIIGILLVSTYYCIENEFSIPYYLSIVFVYVFSYLLWRLGVWAGGDVKLFTAISTLLIPEFLEILPHFNLWGISFPLSMSSYGIPTIFLIFNSVLSIIPLIIIYVLWIILKDKSHLKVKLKESFNFKDAFISLNSLLISYLIINRIGVYHTVLKLILLLVLSYTLSNIMKYDYITIILSITLIIQQFTTGNIITYAEEYIILLIVIAIKNIYHKGIIKEVLTDEIRKDHLEEGMILQYPLYYKENHYYFDKNPWYKFTQEKGKLICSNGSCGITTDDMEILKKMCGNSTVSIKKGLVFAPFVLSGLIITFTIGNTYQLILMILELI